MRERLVHAGYNPVVFYRPVMGFEYTSRRPVQRHLLGQEQPSSAPLSAEIQALVDAGIAKARGLVEDRIREEAKPMIIKAAVLGGLVGFLGGVLLAPALRNLFSK